MDPSRIIEVALTIGATLGAIWLKDVISKATTRQRVQFLEEAFKDLKGEITKLDDTLGRTNQSLASIDATVKGLGYWLKRTEDRLNNL